MGETHKVEYQQEHIHGQDTFRHVRHMQFSLRSMSIVDSGGQTIVRLRQRGAKRLAEALGIQGPFGKNDIAVDEQRLFDVLRAGGSQLFDGFWKEVNRSL